MDTENLSLTDPDSLQKIGIAVAGVAGSIGEVIEDLNVDFVEGSIDWGSSDISRDELDLDALSLDEMDELYAAALECNPIDKILEREKNSPAAQLVRQLLASTATGRAAGQMVQGSQPGGGSGGSASSPSLDELAAGAYDPSTN